MKNSDPDDIDVPDPNYRRSDGENATNPYVREAGSWYRNRI